ncbi:MAG: nitrite reductase, copper-containing, partial [Leptospiraceae bacterium]|nr:nitrite reductase, copper-containing [Leptospiraceae bacterium]
YLNADKKRAIQVVLKGLSGNVTVNGKIYNKVMPAQTMEDEDIANALTFVYNSWGNAGHVITAEEVKAAR